MTRPARNGQHKPRQPGHISTRNGQKAPPVEADYSPLEYMLAIVNDPSADPKRRDRMAKAAAPYCTRPAGTVVSDERGVATIDTLGGINRRRSASISSDRFPGFAPTDANPKIVTLEPDATVRERMRRYRRRQRGGRLFTSIEFSPEETARLNRLGYLRDGELEDRDAIAAAVHILLSNISDEP